MNIRAETDKDKTAVYNINRSAFDTSAEAEFVDKLREQANPIISLVAEEDEIVIGHILFTPVSLINHSELRIMGLAPMAVSPEFQCRGFGSALVQAGLEQCKKKGFGAVVVLGHKRYYPRFGFTPASRVGLSCEYDVPDDVFMYLELQKDYLINVAGKIKYHSAFKSV
jgi:putative acetyltransferase